MTVPVFAIAATNEPCGYDFGEGYLGNAKGTAADAAVVSRLPDVVSISRSRAQREVALKLKSGREIRYKNVACDHSPQHEVLDYLRSQGYFVVRVSKWEDSWLLLVSDTTGKELRLATTSGRTEDPLLSPDGRRLAVIRNDFYVHDSGVQIWEFTSTGVKVIWGYSPGSWYPAHATWEGPSKLKLTGKYWRGGRTDSTFLVSAEKTGKWSIATVAR